MNQYEQIARRWWASARPTELSQMTDPDRFFLTLAEQIQEQVTLICAQLEETTSPPANFLARAGWYNAIKNQAEELALNQLVYELGPEGEPDETPSTLAPLIQEMYDLKQEIAHAVANSEPN